MKNQYRTLALVVLAAALVLLELTKSTVLTEDAPEKRAASERAAACYEAIYAEKLSRGLEMDAGADINRTGMIGLDYSFITTTVGNLEAKRTSTNPNMAAVVVDMLHELKLQPGDKVAVNCSGSFPALNIAVMCALQELQLEPYLISSFGSSTHGANDPEFTYLDMEQLLVEQGLLTHKSDLFSIGGMEDLGKEMPPEIVDAIVARIQGYGYTWFYDEDLIHNVLTRYDIYCGQGDVKCFINVGGNDASFGDSSVMVHTDGGILTQLSEKDNSTGLVQLFLIVSLFSDSTYQVFYYMSATMIMVPYLLSALYYLKVVITSTRAGTPQNLSAWVFAIVGSIYGFWMLYSTGSDQLLISSILYAPGILIFALGKQERHEPTFRFRYESFIAAALVVLAMLSLYLIFNGTLKPF